MFCGVCPPKSILTHMLIYQMEKQTHNTTITLARPSGIGKFETLKRPCLEFVNARLLHRCQLRLFIEILISGFPFVIKKIKTSYRNVDL